MAAAIGGGNASVVATKNESSLVLENHSDVSEEEGWIIIPYAEMSMASVACGREASGGCWESSPSCLVQGDRKPEYTDFITDSKDKRLVVAREGELPDDWKNAPDIHSLHSLDRSFVFPGEQVHILASLSAYKQDTEIITPFKVAAVMSKNGIGQSPKKQNADLEGRSDFVTAQGEVSCDSQVTGLNDNVASKQKTGPQKDICASESFLRMEDYKRQTEVLLERFKNSHFFVKIAELGEPLW